MRITLGFLVLSIVLLNLGMVCAEENASIPDLRGTWVNVYRITDSEVTDLLEMEEGDPTLIFVIENQTGQMYDGYQTYVNPIIGKSMTEGFRGVITDDGKHFIEVGDISGQAYGDISGPDSFSYYYLHHDIPLENETIVESRIVYARFVRESSDITGSNKS